MVICQNAETVHVQRKVKKDEIIESRLYPLISEMPNFINSTICND